MGAGSDLQIVLALTVGETGQITAIDVIADPERLGRLHLAVLPDQAVVPAQGLPRAFSQMSGKSLRIVDRAARRRRC